MCLTEYNEAETMQMFKEEGLEEGNMNAVTIAIDICKEQNMEISYAIEKVASKLKIDQKEAEALVKKYW